MLALYEVVKYLCLEMGIYSVLYINEIMPQSLNWNFTPDDWNFRPLQNAHSTIWRQYTQ